MSKSFYFFPIPVAIDMSTLSLHDALPISGGLVGCARGGAMTYREVARKLARLGCQEVPRRGRGTHRKWRNPAANRDRKSTRLNSSHGSTSYAVFCLKKKTSPPCSPPQTTP